MPESSRRPPQTISCELRLNLIGLDNEKYLFVEKPKTTCARSKLYPFVFDGFIGVETSDELKKRGFQVTTAPAMTRKRINLPDDIGLEDVL